METIVTVIKYLFLGLLQGFTEPIPISSSGHLVLAQHLFGVHPEGLSFEVLVNFASLLAVLLIYRHDLSRLAAGGWNYIVRHDRSSRADFQFIVYLAAATIPAAVAGMLLNDWIAGALKGLTTIGITLIATGVALWLIRNLRGRKSDKDISLKDAVIVGLAQAVALIPGVSRSGSTIVAAMGLGMKQETALKFSFLMYIPVSIGGMILEGAKLAGDPEIRTLALPYAAAFLASFLATYFSLKWFMGVMARGNLRIFSIYCFIAGLAVLLFM